MPKQMLEMSIDDLRRLLAYDPTTGQFRWLCDRQGHVRAGDMAGCVNHSVGYIYIGLGQRRRFAAHRLAWALVHGEWPKSEIDHINGERTDNRIENLRVVTTSENRQNQRRGRGRLGLLGVRRNGKRFSAIIGVNYKTHCLGTFDTPEEAHAAYVTAKRQLHPAGTL